MKISEEVKYSTANITERKGYRTLSFKYYFRRINLC
jgi:hypothetical protein